MTHPVLRFFSSLRLTVWLLAASVLLVFLGTLEQVHLGILEAQRKYFESVIALWPYPREWPLGEWLQVVHLPVPGGYLLGPLLLVNLAAAHFRYFRPSWKLGGIVLIHLGVALLLLGQLATNLLQEESFVWIDEGGSKNYLTSFHEDEFVLVDRSAPATDRVISVPVELLEKGAVLDLPGTDLRLTVREFYRNALISRHGTGPGAGPTPIASHGWAPMLGLVVQETAPTFRQDDRNATTAIVELAGPDGPLGTWLVSTVFEGQLPPQTFEREGRAYQIDLRPRRTYLPYTLELLDFTHDKWPGTEIPRNYASTVRLRGAPDGEDRQTVISMNRPLRHGGLAFYQASFARQDTSSMLQVVRNPGWLMPYFACSLVTLGLLWQFGYALVAFLQRRNPSAPAAPCHA